MSKRAITLLLILCIALVACMSASPAPDDDLLAALPTSEASTLPTLLELLSEDTNLVFFLNGLDGAGLMDDLQNGGPFTVFAPSNIAFSNAGLIVSQTDSVVLEEIVDQHLIDGNFSQTALLDVGSVVSLSGEPLPISQDGDVVKVDYAPLVGEARQASNGILFVIDTLLLPPETGPEKSMWRVLQADGRFSTLISFIKEANLVETMRFDDEADAFLAPTDEAFAMMPADVVALLENNPQAAEVMIRYHFLTPNGWPKGEDLLLADLTEMDVVQTSIAQVDSFGLDDYGSDNSYFYGLEELAIMSTDAGLQIGTALVLTANMQASNGVIYAIDTVLILPNLLESVP